MRYTARGAAELEAYLDRVRRSLEGRADVDAEDVVAGLREHVETELSLAGTDPAAAEDVAEVVARLGPADAMLDGASAPASGEGVSPRAGGAVLGLAGAGSALVATRWMPVGVALLALAVAGSRVLLSDDGRAPQDAVTRLVRLVWQAGVAVAGFTLLLAPAVAVWASAQIGGLLEDPLAAWVGADGSDRPPRYWLGMATAAAAATGGWWVLAGAALRHRGARIRQLLGPARFVAPRGSGRILIGAGALLLIVSLVGVWVLSMELVL